jgi:hypothetical protein
MKLFVNVGLGVELASWFVCKWDFGSFSMESLGQLQQLDISQAWFRDLPNCFVRVVQNQNYCSLN